MVEIYAQGSTDSLHWEYSISKRSLRSYSIRRHVYREGAGLRLANRAGPDGMRIALYFPFTPMVPEDAGCSAVAGCPDMG